MSDGENFDATALAAEATSDPVEDLAEQEAAPATPSSTPELPSVVTRLFDGRAEGPTIREIQGQYGFQRELSMVARGCLRVADTGGIPPIFDILGGTVLSLKARTNAMQQDSGDDQGDRPSGVPGRE